MSDSVLPFLPNTPRKRSTQRWRGDRRSLWIRHPHSLRCRSSLGCRLSNSLSHARRTRLRSRLQLSLNIAKTTVTAASARLAIVAHPQMLIHSTNVVLQRSSITPGSGFSFRVYTRGLYGILLWERPRARACGTGASKSSLTPTALWLRSPRAGHRRRGTRLGAGCLPAPHCRRCRPS